MFDLVGFTYVFGLSTLIQDSLRVHHRIFRFFVRWDIGIVLDRSSFENKKLKITLKILMSGSFQTFGIFVFFDFHVCKNNMFKDDWGFSCIFYVFW